MSRFSGAREIQRSLHLAMSPFPAGTSLWGRWMSGHHRRPAFPPEPGAGGVAQRGCRGPGQSASPHRCWDTSHPPPPLSSQGYPGPPAAKPQDVPQRLLDDEDYAGRTMQGGRQGEAHVGRTTRGRPQGRILPPPSTADAVPYKTPLNSSGSRATFPHGPRSSLQIR